MVFALHWACLFGICCLLFDIVFVLLVSLICLFYGGWLLLVVMFWFDVVWIYGWLRIVV